MTTKNLSVCDCCGHEELSSTTSRNCCTVVGGGERWVSLEIRDKNLGTQYQGKHYDLCEKCSKKIKALLE